MRPARNGKTFMGIIRTTVLIGQGGRIAPIWRNVKVDGHAERVGAHPRDNRLRKINHDRLKWQRLAPA
jgi:peroxiredoxin